MSSKSKRNVSTEPQPISTQAETGEAVTNAAHREEIRGRAYEIYLERGEQPGREVDDWLQAERELEGGETPGCQEEKGAFAIRKTLQNKWNWQPN